MCGKTMEYRSDGFMGTGFFEGLMKCYEIGCGDGYTTLEYNKNH